MSKKNKRTSKFTISTALLIVSAIAATVIILFPIVLQCPVVSDAVSSIAKPLKYETYKGEYFSAVGGLVGSFLAVTSAIWIQYTSEEKQRKEQLESEQKREAAHMRKYATIVYFDIKFFYEEMSPFLTTINRIANNERVRSGEIPSSSRLEKNDLFDLIHKRRNILVDRNWIVDVAELAYGLDDTAIRNIYAFYGVVSNLAARTDYKMISDATYGDIEEICLSALSIGNFDDSKGYVMSSDSNNLLKTLEKHMTTNDSNRVQKSEDT